MTGSIKECDLAALESYGVSTDLLRDSACLTFDNVCGTDPVEERCLTMVNVTHDNDDRRPRLEVLGIALTVIEKDILFVLLFKKLCIDTERIRNKACSIEIEFLVDRSHNAELHECHDDLGALLADTFCKLLNGNECRDLDLSYRLLLRNRLLELLLLFLLI